MVIGCMVALVNAAHSKPNIILIFADDLGWRDVGYQSEGKFLTPHIDRMAADGQVFSSAYATGANCAPSRACLLSGLYTPRHGVYAVDSTDRGPKPLQRLIPIPNTDGLRGDFVTIAESLKEAGYATGHFGKWHLAGRDGDLPSRQGFDVTWNSFGNEEIEEGQQLNLAGPPEDPKGVYALTRKAIEFMAANSKAGTPFFCYLAHHAIHTPLQTRPETRELIRDRARDASVPPAYMGCTYDFDDSVGLLMAALKELKLEETTLVILTSDNGAIPQSSQEPLRGSKGGYYEGGIRVPMVVRWPGVVKPGSRCELPVTNVDFYPTFLDVAGVPLPQVTPLDGESLLPLFNGGNSLQRSGIFWHFPGYLDGPILRGRDPVFRTRPVSVIRKGDWKLHLYHEEWQLDGGRNALTTNNAVELYHLDNDIGERNNLAGENTAMRDELLDDLLAWMDATEASLPTELNPKYDPLHVPAHRSGRESQPLSNP